MKFLIVIAFFVVFKADCRHFNDEPTNQVEASNIEEELFPGGHTNSDLTAPRVTNENEENDNALRGKGGKNNLNKIIKKLESKIKNITDELQSQMQNINDNNTGLQSDVNSIKSNMSSIVSKLNSIEAKQGTGILRHFPYASYKKTWADAKAYCESIGGKIWTPLDKAETVAAFKACGTLCWNGWHKVGDLWVTGTGQVMNHDFWAPAEPDSGEDAAWSSENGIYGRPKSQQYGWTCQM